jgi:hypothetical protein
MKMSDEDGEKLVFSFQLKNCIKEYYYQISIYDDKENFQTEKILCEVGGETLSFIKKMEYIFLFEKRQKITLIISKHFLYDKENNINTAKVVYLSNIVTQEKGIYETNLSEDINTEIFLLKAQKSKENAENIYLFDYLKSGIKLSCFISFDFSQKNTATIKDDNLIILKNIFENIEEYIEDHLYFSSGFGAKNESSKNPAFDMDKFKLNSDELIGKYKVSLESKNIIPEKNIVLSPLIKKISSDVCQIYDPKINNYNVLFALISKDIDKKDKKNLLHQIIASSYLPLSIFIIGIGNHDFTELKSALKKINKYSNKGAENIRQNILFTSYNTKITANKTISLCLKELSKQMIQYYIYNKYFPEKDNNEIKDSISLFESYQQNIDNNNDDIDETESAYTEITNEYPTPGNSNNDVINNNSKDINESLNCNNTKNINISNSNNSNGSYKLQTSILGNEIMKNNPYKPHNKAKKIEKSGASSSTNNSLKNSGE